MILIFIAITLVAGLASLATFIYFLRKGQFENVEDVKYQLFREEEEDAKISQLIKRR